MDEKRESTRKKAMKTVESVMNMLEKDQFSGVICVFMRKEKGLTNMVTHEIDTQPADLFFVEWNIKKLIDNKLSSQSASIIE